MSEPFKTWSAVSKSVPEDALRALDRAAIEFFDDHKIGPRDDHYLLSEGFVWKVVNGLQSNGFTITNNKENA